RSPGTALLEDVGQLVRQKMPPLPRLRSELATPEDDVPADRERAGLERRRRGLGLRSGVDAHAAEVGAEPRLEIGAYRSRQLASAREARGGGRGGRQLGPPGIQRGRTAGSRSCRPLRAGSGTVMSPLVPHSSAHGWAPAAAVSAA